MAENRIGDDLELRLAVVAEIERDIELAERAHRLLAELEELVHLPADATIRDRLEQRDHGCVFAQLWLHPTKRIRNARGQVEPPTLPVPRE